MTDTTIDKAPADLLAGTSSKTSFAVWLWPSGLAAILAWAAVAVVTLKWPDGGEWGRSGEFAGLALAVAAALAVVAVFGRVLGKPGRLVRAAGPWALVLGLALLAWEVLTAKLYYLPQPFFPPPQSILEVYLDDFPRLFECLYHSLGLLLTGYLLGAFTGFVTGVAIGWSKAVRYWGHPVLMLIGPMPATAWLPIAFFAFPSSWSASVFLIGLAAGIPVAVLSFSGVASVNSAYYDIARTLGARPSFQVLRVAIPAAMPHVFVGLFMGMCSSFAVLVVAEMMGVKAGLGWYLQWAQGWAAYNSMYAALAVTAIVCSGLVTLLFKSRDHFLAWQKGLLKW